MDEKNSMELQKLGGKTACIANPSSPFFIRKGIHFQGHRFRSEGVGGITEKELFCTHHTESEDRSPGGVAKEPRKPIGKWIERGGGRILQKRIEAARFYQAGT